MPATNPALLYLQIECPHIAHIATLPNQYRCWISVWHILHNVYQAMHVVVDRDDPEFDDPDVLRQFFHRLRSIEDPEDRWEELREMRIRMVDLLDGVHVFAGLAEDWMVESKWNVVLRRASF
jgi:hypothetical protein